MLCTIVQADLGPLFEDVDPDVAADFIEAATEIVLGPTDCQAAKYLSYINCCVDPCRMIKLLASHLLAVTPGSGGEGAKEVTSERVGDVSVTYANATSSSGLFAGSSYGTLYKLQLAKYEKCQARRRTFPRAVGTTRNTNA